MNLKKAVLCVLAISLIAAVGCKKDEGYRSVTGVVTVNGEPVADASVMFYNQASDGEGGAAKTNADGSYAATGARASEGGTGLKPGEYKVTIAKFEETSDPDQEAYDKGEITYDELQDRIAKKGAYAGVTPSKLLTPKQYSTIGTTPLTITVSDNPAENVFDFNLE